MPRHEKSIEGHFNLQHILHFLPAYEKVSTWRNRQKVRVKMPLFPRYIFASVEPGKIGLLRKTPGVVRIVGTQDGPTPVPASQIEFLRLSAAEHHIKPYPSPPIGRRVRIQTGLMAGLEGTLVRKENRSRFVITLSAIQQSVSVDADAVILEVI
jgi:transcription antitermination factor NusG